MEEVCSMCLQLFWVIIPFDKPHDRWQCHSRRLRCQCAALLFCTCGHWILVILHLSLTCSVSCSAQMSTSQGECGQYKQVHASDSHTVFSRGICSQALTYWKFIFFCCQWPHFSSPSQGTALFKNTHLGCLPVLSFKTSQGAVFDKEFPIQLDLTGLRNLGLNN